MTTDKNSTRESHLSGLYALCVRRPVLAITLNLLIIVAGIAALLGVEVREMPNVDRPVVTVTTTYSGAPPEVTDAEITSVLEKAISRTAGIESISSNSKYGRSRITVEFNDSVDVSEAANDIRDAVSGAGRNLPEDADTPVVVKADADADPVMRVVVTSDEMRIEELSKFVDDEIVDRITSVPGVASVDLYGSQTPVFKVAINVQAMSSRGLTPDNLRSVLEELALDTSGGSLETGDQELFVRANSDVKTAEQIGMVKLNETTRIRDIAFVSYGPERASSGAFYNGKRAVGMGIIRSANSNTIDISNDVRAEIERMQDQLPNDVEVNVSSDDATFIGGAIKEVVFSLFLSTSIVIGVMLLFLGSIRVTLIPAVTVPVALIGALVGIWLAGFSANVLTLLALLLATGMVVDDAIVVLENISKRVHNGQGPRAAAILGTREVFFAVITTTATLAAVFIPISFLPGSVGKLFSEFGFVLAISVMLSSFVALTLAPMMASRLLRTKNYEDTHKPSATWTVISNMGTAIERWYSSTLDWTLRRPFILLGAATLFVILGASQYTSLPRQLTPTEDRSVIFMIASTPQGASLDYTAGKMSELEYIAQPYVENGEARSVMSLVGMGGQINRGFLVMSLKDWAERDRSQQEIVNELQRKTAKIPGLKVRVAQPNTIGIRGAGQGLRFAVTGTNYDELAENADDIVSEMQARYGDKVGFASVSYETTQPQLLVSVDRERANDLGLSSDRIASNLRMLLDGSSVADLFVEDDGIPMVMEAGGLPLRSTRDLENIFIKSKDGTMLPMSSIVSIEEEAVAPSLTREEQQRAVPVTISINDGYDLAQAISDMKEVAEEVLPEGTNVTLLSEAAVLEKTTSNVYMTFLFAILVVFLVLAAQFESFMSAFVILCTVPFGISAAIISIGLTGGSINVYSQIGIILLVGLMAKNGILIVEFANTLREEGRSVFEAIHDACLIRFRPVVMTVVSTVLGGVPLVMAFGAGAEARIEMGWVIVGGLGFATLSTLFVTPAAYLLLMRFTKPRKASEEKLHSELDKALGTTNTPAE
ncbi:MULTISPECIES: efflux RND transporter permease subunit [unclassified Pseudovibrio]|uniref:efflux RND transporter permease subunit n=1 Tax=unclassified Pseudovibrio TaxID=2627060 RepID=UPI0007AE7423|nr:MULTISPECIES: efflux RND transporter permease subunit [unclassified Pseudovibrio]KZK92464.1 Multidrug resistance protein MdtB [Pseudovibrio sp. W74]KZL08641.1 Multidrug resistance protein MdtB [Pseudovibrio sp. Ad14]